MAEVVVSRDPEAVLVRRRTAWTIVAQLLKVVSSYLVLTLLGALMAIPFIWMIVSSFKHEGDIFTYPPVWFPDPLIWTNFRDVVNSMPFILMSWNTLYVAILNVIGGIIVCGMAAFAFARMQFPGRDALFIVLLASMMVPAQVTMIPVFLVMQKLNWLDTHFPLWVPGFTGGAFGTFLLRQFFLTLPSELDDAARIDGAGSWTIFWRIFLPLSKPALATLAIFIFLYRWNDLLHPIIYLNTPEKMTLPVGLAYFRGQYRTEWALLMAGAMMSVIPVLVLYASFQRYFVRGVVLSGIKG
ncbi:MAG: carbohydrate ABC transporter permease [Chloroflexi bacterium]|nr:carbohydrate ABC transporter permease [Chloroflexota bacterium]MCY3938392.1 carbohydrate ABC transporter permease [Chloroflexota bacterium]